MPDWGPSPLPCSGVEGWCPDHGMGGTLCAPRGGPGVSRQLRAQTDGRCSPEEVLGPGGDPWLLQGPPACALVPVQSRQASRVRPGRLASPSHRGAVGFPEQDGAGGAPPLPAQLTGHGGPRWVPAAGWPPGCPPCHIQAVAGTRLPSVSLSSTWALGPHLAARCPCKSTLKPPGVVGQPLPAWWTGALRGLGGDP